MLLLLYHGMASTQDMSLNRAHRVTSNSFRPPVEQVGASEKLNFIVIEFLESMVKVSQVIWTLKGDKYAIFLALDAGHADVISTCDSLLTENVPLIGLATFSDHHYLDFARVIIWQLLAGDNMVIND